MLSNFTDDPTVMLLAFALLGGGVLVVAGIRRWRRPAKKEG